MDVPPEEYSRIFQNIPKYSRIFENQKVGWDLAEAFAQFVSSPHQLLQVLGHVLVVVFHVLEPLLEAAGAHML